MLKLCLALLATGAAFGAEFAWAPLSPRFSYTDFEMTCTTTIAANLYYVGLKTESGKVTAASLKVDPRDPQSDSYQFTSEEVAQVTVYSEPKGDRRWLATLPASTNVVAWMMSHSGTYSEPCYAPNDVTEITIEKPIFEFDLKFVQTGAPISATKTMHLTGKRENGDHFVSKIKLNQEPF